MRTSSRAPETITKVRWTAQQITMGATATNLKAKCNTVSVDTSQIYITFVLIFTNKLFHTWTNEDLIHVDEINMFEVDKSST